MQFSANVTTVTRENIIPDLFNQINVGSPFLIHVLAQAKAWTSGKSFDLPIKHSKSTNGGVTGIADQLDSNRQDNRATMSFQPRTLYKPVVVADIEVELNKGDERVLDLLTTELHSQAQDLMEDAAEQLFEGTGTGNEWSSIAMAADDTTNYSSYGGLSRSTYPALDGYYLASTGAITLAKLATAFDAVEHGTSAPDMLATTKSIWSDYEALLTPTVAANYTAQGDQMASMTPDGIVMGKAKLSGTQGFRAVTYRGEAVVKDEKCPTGKLFLVNTRPEAKFRNFGFAAINRSGKQYSTVNFTKKMGDPTGTFGSRKVPRGFNFRDMMSPVDQLAEVGYLLLDGEFLAGQPRLQGQLDDIT